MLSFFLGLESYLTSIAVLFFFFFLFICSVFRYDLINYLGSKAGHVNKIDHNRIDVDDDSLAPIFPPGVITEILTRLPMKTLIQFQLVCKDWQSMINQESRIRDSPAQSLAMSNKIDHRVDDDDDDLPGPIFPPGVITEIQTRLPIETLIQHWQSMINDSSHFKQLHKVNKESRIRDSPGPILQTKPGQDEYAISYEQTKMDQSEPIFPIDIIMEIMSRLPLKSLSRCQLVCKDWQALIHNNHYFTKMHINHSNVIYHWSNTTRSTDTIQLHNRTHDSFSFTHGCYGLLLMKNKNTKKHYLWNPATRLALQLPDPHTQNHELALSFVPSTKSYRVVSFFTDNELLGCEVFTPGQSDNVWRRLHDNNNLHEITLSSKPWFSGFVSSGEAVHCVVVDGLNKKEVVSLELETEKFTVNRFPDVGWKNYWEVDWDGKLAIADVVGQNLEVLELEDHKKGRWSVEKKIIHLHFLKENEGKVVVIPLIVRKGCIWFWLKDEKIFTYMISTGETTDVKEEKALWLSSKIYPYKPSLTSFDGMVPDTMLEVYRPTFNLS